MQNLISTLQHRLQTIHFDLPEPGVSGLQRIWQQTKKVEDIQAQITSLRQTQLPPRPIEFLAFGQGSISRSVSSYFSFSNHLQANTPFQKNVFQEPSKFYNALE